MGGLLTCCMSDGHCLCCSIISLLGVIFYAVFFITVLLQPQFLNIEIGKPDETLGALLIALAFYLAFFLFTVFIQFRRKAAKQRVTRPTSYRQLQEQKDPVQHRFTKESVLTEG